MFLVAVRIVMAERVLITYVHTIQKWMEYIVQMMAGGVYVDLISGPLNFQLGDLHMSHCSIPVLSLKLFNLERLHAGR